MRDVLCCDFAFAVRGLQTGSRQAAEPTSCARSKSLVGTCRVLRVQCLRPGSKAALFLPASSLCPLCRRRWNGSCWAVGHELVLEWQTPRSSWPLRPAVDDMRRGDRGHVPHGLAEAGQFPTSTFLKTRRVGVPSFTYLFT